MENLVVKKILEVNVSLFQIGESSCLPTNSLTRSPFWPQFPCKY